VQQDNLVQVVLLGPVDLLDHVENQDLEESLEHLGLPDPREAEENEEKQDLPDQVGQVGH
jgi:hypothetical protein